MKTIKWKDFVKEADQNRRVYDAKKKRLFEDYFSNFKKFITLEIIIGIVAAFLLYTRFGIVELQRTILSWIIGITLVMTIVTAMMNRYKKIFHL